MRSYQVFASLPQEGATAFLRTLAEQAPLSFARGLAMASIAGKARTTYLRKQPFEKQAAAIRRALARVVGNDVAEELLAVYFLECRKDLLLEWLDAVGLEHDEGSLLEESPASPAKADLERAATAFRAGDRRPDRELLLHAFAAQSAVDWPHLEALLEPLS